MLEMRGGKSESKNDLIMQQPHVKVGSASVIQYHLEA